MKHEIEAGLVFAIRLRNGAYGLGHLIARQEPIFYMAGYDIQSETPVLDERAIQQAKPVILGNFFDVLIRIGRWLPVRRSALPAVPFPYFKIRIGDKFYVEPISKLLEQDA